MAVCARALSTSLRLGSNSLARNLNSGLRGQRIIPGNLRQFSVLASRTKLNVEARQTLTTLSSPRHYSVAATKAVVKDRDESLVLKLTDGSSIEFSYVWLRDCCLCPLCHEPSAKSRLVRMQDLPVDCRPSDVKIEASTVTITWDDGHVSPYPIEWLVERGFSPKNLQNRTKIWPLAAQPWGRDLLDDLPKDSFQNLMEDDRALFNWICKMEKYGFFVITDAPCETGSVKKFSERIAFLRLTNYGQTFTVKAKIDPSNAAYTSAALGLHVDLPYYYYTPGIQMLHCISQVPTKGGENQFADGFFAAEIVKKLRPDYYQTLCTSLVDFYDIGTDYYKFHKFARRPVIQFDTMGNMTQVNYNNQVRDYFSYLPAKEMTALLKAMKFYDDIMYQPDNHIEIKLKDGEIACFHNYRIMHGREGFEVLGTGGERHYEGGYLDWDEVHSRRRVLQEELNMFN